MPNDYASKIIRMYLQLNPDVNIENLIFEKLDGKKFIQIKKWDRIYFVNSENDEYAQIRYDINKGVCTIDNELINEISYLFSLEKTHSKQVISSWVAGIIKRRIYTYRGCPPEYQRLLRIPNIEIDFNE